MQDPANRNQQFGRIATLKAAFLVTGSTYASYAFGLVTSALIARALGPDDYGSYAYVVWLASVLIMIANNGLAISGIRFVSESLGRESMETANRVHGWLWRRQRASLFAVLCVLVLVLSWNRPGEWKGNMGLLLFIVATCTAAKTIYLFDSSVAKGYGRFNVEAYSNIFVSLVNVLAVIGLWFLHATVIAYMVLFTVTSVGYAVFATVMLHRGKLIPKRGELNHDLLASMKRHLFWTVLLALVGSLSNRSIETFLLSTVVGTKEVGFFTLATTLTRGGVDVLTAGLTTVLMPLMAHAYGAGGLKRVGPIFSTSLRYFLFFGLLLAGVGTLWGDVAVTAMYGSSYAPVVPVFRIMVIVGGLTLSDGAFGAILSTTENQAGRVAVAFFSLIASAVGALALVPTYGLMGAAISFATAKLIGFSILVIIVVRTLDVQLPMREIVRLFGCAAVAGLAAAGIAWFVPGLVGGSIAGLVYAAVFGAFSIILDSWHTEDVAQLLSVTRRFPRLLGWFQPSVMKWLARLEQRSPSTT
jgi:O-antigen/teichoic acid export membrane protein